LFSKAPKIFLIHEKGLTKYTDALCASTFVNMEIANFVAIATKQKISGLKTTIDSPLHPPILNNMK
jgi:hypothetical protein